MKRKKILSMIIGIFAIGIFFTSCASFEEGTIPLETRKIIEVPNTNQSTLFVRCNTAAVELFKNASSVIQYADKEAGIIKGKFVILNLSAGIYYYNIDVIVTIETKDSKVRLSCSGINAALVGDALNGLYPNARKSFLVKEETAIAERVKGELLLFEHEFAKKLNTSDSGW